MPAPGCLSTERSAEEREQRRLLAVVAAVLALDATFYSAVAPLLPGLRRDLALTDDGAGLLVAAYALGLLGASLPAGWLTARIGPRRAMLAGLILFGVASIGFGAARSVLVLDLTRALQGVAGALSWTAGFAWLLAAAPRERHGVLIGSAISAALAGSLAGPALGALTAQVGRGPIFFAVAVLAAAMSFVVWVLPAPSSGGDLGLTAAVRAFVTGPGRAAGWVVLLAGALAGGLAVLAPLRLDDLGASATAVGAVFVSAGVGEIALGPLVGRVSDRGGPARPLVAALAVTAMLLVVLATVGSLVLTIATLVVLLPAIVAMITPAFAALGTVAEERAVALAAVFGVGNLAWAAGEGAGALVAGWLANAGHGDPGYLGMAALSGATLLALARRDTAPAV